MLSIQQASEEQMYSGCIYKLENVLFHRLNSPFLPLSLCISEIRRILISSTVVEMKLRILEALRSQIYIHLLAPLRRNLT